VGQLQNSDVLWRTVSFLHRCVSSTVIFLGCRSPLKILLKWGDEDFSITYSQANHSWNLFFQNTLFKETSSYIFHVFILFLLRQIKINLNPLILFMREGLTTREKIGIFGRNFRRLRKCVDPTFFENIVQDEKKKLRIV
jgi:hypothetical protein